MESGLSGDAKHARSSVDGRAVREAILFRRRRLDSDVVRRNGTERHVQFGIDVSDGWLAAENWAFQNGQLDGVSAGDTLIGTPVVFLAVVIRYELQMSI